MGINKKENYNFINFKMDLNFTNINNDKIVEKLINDFFCNPTHRIENSTIVLILFLILYIVKNSYDIWRRNVRRT